MSLFARLRETLLGPLTAAVTLPKEVREHAEAVREVAAEGARIREAAAEQREAWDRDEQQLRRRRRDLLTETLLAARDRAEGSRR